MDSHLYSVFLVYWPLKVLYNTPHLHTDGRGCHARCQLHIGSNLGFNILLKVTSTCSSAHPEGAGIQTINLPITRPPALHPELQPPTHTRWNPDIAAPDLSTYYSPHLNLMKQDSDLPYKNASQLCYKCRSWIQKVRQENYGIIVRWSVFKESKGKVVILQNVGI